MDRQWRAKEGAHLTEDLVLGKVLGSGFQVQGTHTYATAGTKKVSTSIQNADGAFASASSKATVKKAPKVRAAVLRPLVAMFGME